MSGTSIKAVLYNLDSLHMASKSIKLIHSVLFVIEVRGHIRWAGCIFRLLVNTIVVRVLFVKSIICVASLQNSPLVGNFCLRFIIISYGTHQYEHSEEKICPKPP